jgi:hypothetical protein
MTNEGAKREADAAEQPATGEDKVVSLVRDFFEEKALEAVSDAKKGKKGKSSRIAIPVAIGIACASIWLVPVFVPFGKPNIPDETLEQGARMTVYLASLQLGEYQDSTGRLPLELKDAGIEEEALRYSRLGDNIFELELDHNGRSLRYNSQTPALDFLGSAANLLKGS